MATNKIKKVNPRGGRIWVTMESGLKLALKDYGQDVKIPFDANELAGKTLQEAFEIIKLHK